MYMTQPELPKRIAETYACGCDKLNNLLTMLVSTAQCADTDA